MSSRTRWLPLAMMVALQALLLFHNLDLLPIWGDEVFTLQTVAHPLAEIPGIVQRDIHPPLYFLLLHGWAQLPLPWTGLAALRAFSALMALACTVLLDGFWLRRWRPAHRCLALALFAFSPCLLLYGRMARSYTMQTALALAAVSLCRLWMREPRRIAARAVPALLAMALLLYTHYLPGCAILAGFGLTGWRRLGPARIAAFGVAAAAAYAPWLMTLGGALRAWGHASSYSLGPNPVVNEVIKVCFATMSWTIGETFFPASLLLVPVAVFLIWRGAVGRAGGPAPLLAVAGIIGYAGATRWVSWPFVAARLLWLLPFATMAMAIGLTRLRTPLRRAVTVLLLVSFASSTVLYFRRENFANLGYASPVREIAERVKREAAPSDLILADRYNTDYFALQFYLGTLRAVSMTAGVTVPSTASTIWVVRNTRDVSPGRLVSSLGEVVCRGRTREDRFYSRYPEWLRAALGLVSKDAPRYFYEVDVCR